MDTTRAWCWVWSRLHRGQEGASLVEYALLVALIAIVCIVAVTVLGGNASTKFSGTASALS
jgi:pilus assembly protein Flp/PilA